MKHTIQKNVAVIFAAISFVTPLSVVAAGEVLLTDFTNNQPAILPNNPFYAIKSGFQKLMTGSSILGALQFLDRRAAEVMTSYQLATQDERLMSKALRSYRDAAQSLADRLSRFDATLLGEVGSIEYENFFNRLDDRLFVHARFIDDLRYEITDFALTKVLAELENEIVKSALINLGGLEDVSGFSSRVIESNQDIDPAIVLRNAETLTTFIFAITEQGVLPTSDQFVLMQLQHELSQIAVDGLADSSLTEIELHRTHDPINRLYVLAHLAELATDPELKAVINRARFELEMEAERLSLMTAPAARVRMHAVSEYADFVLAAIQEESSKEFVALRDRIAFHGEQAQALLAADNYLGSYLQSSLLSAVSAHAYASLLGQ